MGTLWCMAAESWPFHFAPSQIPSCLGSLLLSCLNGAEAGSEQRSGARTRSVSMSLLNPCPYWDIMTQNVKHHIPFRHSGERPFPCSLYPKRFPESLSNTTCLRTSEKSLSFVLAAREGSDIKRTSYEFAVFFWSQMIIKRKLDYLYECLE